MKTILPVLCVLLLFGCGKSPKQQAEEQAEVLLREKILQFRATHGASIDWLREMSKWEDRWFTANFQRLFLDQQESVFLFPVEIADLVRKADSYLLIADLSYDVFVSECRTTLVLKCPVGVAEAILDNQMGSSYDTFLVAAKIDSVRNVALELMPALNYSPEELYVEAEAADIYIDVNLGGHVILVGECIALENMGTSYVDFVELATELAIPVEDNE